MTISQFLVAETGSVQIGWIFEGGEVWSPCFARSSSAQFLSWSSRVRSPSHFWGGGVSPVDLKRGKKFCSLLRVAIKSDGRLCHIVDVPLRRRCARLAEREITATSREFARIENSPQNAGYNTKMPVLWSAGHRHRNRAQRFVVLNSQDRSREST
eukprot:CAMPEP_0198734636 /NCGR_PEP_ID=MMETSP1475-20131203/54135_1 /TAXON_ID= ORGANISM="Unidentified sp., Strain CCMP1999" /NCGR_SAMPLE_ID=MMETSP1475 /ASSEMBLY_ACC=CAM_ASM_001111 /LENGTH=154 /DNA_ID=CAMNT_0044498149 /DNA_START=64 /DNA_END=528 /DNA_ORIENTATION=-